MLQLHVEPFGSAGPLHPGVCRDNNPACPQWAAAGECEANPVFMRGSDTHRGHCRLSCNVCRPCAEGDAACLEGNLAPGELAAWRQQAAGGGTQAAAAA
jgi:prolyl 4-hydroxylase